jgi:hypothetical protein
VNDLERLTRQKAEAFRECVTSDKRWSLQNELMCQVFGFTLYGYVFGVGRLNCFMDIEVINEIAVSQLTTLGIGPQYAKGLVESALKALVNKNDESIYSQLVGIGHSYFTATGVTAMVDSIFANTAQLEKRES